MKVRIPDTVREHRERQLAQMESFRAGTRELAQENGFPVISPTGTFIVDARAAWLIECLESHLLAQHAPRSRPGWFSASALGKSDAELIAAYRGEAVDEDMTAQKLRVFSVGHDRDATYKGWLKACGLSAVGSDEDRHVTIPHLRLMGECDDILRSPTGFTVFEMKTINPYSFGRLDAPQEAHTLQVHAYMAGLALRDAVVLYENKASQDLRAFYVEFDQALWDSIAERLRRLRALAEA